MLRQYYRPKLFKTAKIIVVTKQGKSPNNVSIQMSNILEKLLLQILNSDTGTEEWTFLHRFGFY